MHLSESLGIWSNDWSVLESLLCLQSFRWDWVMEHFIKSHLLPNNCLKFQNLPTSQLLSQVWAPPFPSLLNVREMEEKLRGCFAKTFFPAQKVLSYGGSALPHFSPQQCCSEWCSKAALMIQGCFCKCYLCTVRNGDLRQMGPFLLSRILWRVCTFSWGPRQVHCLLFSKIGSFHHRKWDCACKDLEIRY